MGIEFFLKMRERTFRVDREKLESLSKVYRPSKIAEKLNISKQRWHSYKIEDGNDMPESIVDQLCAHFSLNKDDLILS